MTFTEAAAFAREVLPRYVVGEWQVTSTEMPPRHAAWYRHASHFRRVGSRGKATPRNTILIYEPVWRALQVDEVVVQLHDGSARPWSAVKPVKLAVRQVGTTAALFASAEHLLPAA